jgi:hypothetical protein
MIGRERVIWRYDPVIVTGRFTLEWHLKAFESMAGRLGKYTDKCVISFVDLYRKILRNIRTIGAKERGRVATLVGASGMAKPTIWFWRVWNL